MALGSASAIMLALFMTGHHEFCLVSTNGDMVVNEVIVEFSFPLPVAAAYAQERLALRMCSYMAESNVRFDFENMPLLVEFSGRHDSRRWQLRYYEPPKEYARALKRKQP